MATNQARPLEGIRVLDLTVALAGPYGSMMLGGMGAEVIRVEAPGGGDIARTNPPFVGEQGIHFGHHERDDVSLTILNRARNKKSITLDLKFDEGREPKSISTSWAGPAIRHVPATFTTGLHRSASMPLGTDRGSAE